MPYGALHVHSNFSVLDGTTTVRSLVDKSRLLDYSFLGLSDHGNMAGTVQLYKMCRKAGIIPFPGVEAYTLDPRADTESQYKADTKRFHLGLYALTLNGYKALVRLVSLSHTRPRFNKFPRITFADLAELGQQHGDDVLLLTGCYFGYLQQQYINEGTDAAARVLQTYANWFPNTVVELQHHNIRDEDHNDDAMNKILVSLAHRFHLPVIGTPDSHYTNQRERNVHALMKRMVYGGVEDEFPGDSFHFPSQEWMFGHYPLNMQGAILAGMNHVLDLNRLSIPPLDEFRVHMPAMAKRPDTVLARTCEKELGTFLWRDIKKTKHERYWIRLREELKVIEDLGMANYFLIWVKCVKWCREQHICIEARGSANGSLVCFLLGITQIDPIKWDVNYERFISPDRIKPPDIDMDIEDVRRGEVLAWLKEHFECVQIGTFSKLGTTTNEDGEVTGSAFVSYMSYLRKQCLDLAKEAFEEGRIKKGEIASYGARIFAKRYSNIKNIDDLYRYRAVSYRDWMSLKRMTDMDIYRSYGVHAAGVLLGSRSLSIDDYVPRMLVASSETSVSQFDMDDVEEIGLLKMDWLGQAVLAVMRICQELIGRGDPTYFGWIPDDDREACKILRSGLRDTGVFHFEAFTKSKGGKEMGVQSTKDAVIATAAYMPGCVDSGQKDAYLRTRRDPNKKRDSLHRALLTHQIVYDVLRETNGVMVFQEHPLQILRKLGMSVASVNATYKILKDSGRGAVERNRDRLAALKMEYDKLCDAQGVDEPEDLWHSITGFMAYGFNKAHSAGYGLRSYRCAYLKAHYPLEFMTALLTVWAGRKKEALYVREARRLGIRLAPPDINISGVSWTMDRKHNSIRRGLLSIPGIGDKAAQEIADKAPYESIEDLVTRVSGHSVSGGKEYLKTGKMSGKLLALDDAGALGSIK